MNQSTTTAAVAARPSGSADAPDISFVLRRYIWLIIIGTILGTGIAGGLWAYLYRTAPRYTATVRFQVMPPPLPPGTSSNVQQVSPSQEEITRFIRRQMIYIKSEGVLERSLQTDEFQHDFRDPTSGAKSRWLSENVLQAKKRLKEDMDVTPIPTSDVFEINMTAKDKDEAARLVNAIARVYMDSLANDSKLNLSRDLEQLARFSKDRKRK